MLSIAISFPFNKQNLLSNAIPIYNAINSQVRQLDGITIVFQNIGLALLTILIPLAIVILTEVYKERGSPEKKTPLAELDLHVILEYIFRAKFLIGFSIMIFLPLAFWSLWNGSLALLLIIISGLGIGFTIAIILNIYNWLKADLFTDIFSIRFSYLKSKKAYEIVNVWKSIWNTENINMYNERNFFMIFSSGIDRIIAKKKVEGKSLASLSTLMTDYCRSIEKRSLDFKVIDTIMLPKLLEWNFYFWKSLRLTLQKEQTDNDFMYWTLTPSEIRKALELITINNVKNRFAMVFFQNLSKHISLHKKDEIMVKGHKHQYIPEIFDILFPILIEDRDYMGNSTLWEENIPADWKVTFANLTNAQNLESKIMLTYYLNQFSRDLRIPQYIRQLTQGNTRTTFSLTCKTLPWLFPEVDSELFAIILLFANSIGDDKITETIEQDWRQLSAFVHRAKVYSVTSMEEMEAQIKEEQVTETNKTFELIYAIPIFRVIFAEEWLIGYIAKAMELSYQAGSEEEKKRLDLLNIFEDMWAYLQNNPLTE
jgi:hypothetical protein